MKSQEFQKIDQVALGAASPGGRLYAPTNIKAVPTGPKNIRVNWNPSGNAAGYRVGHYLKSTMNEQCFILFCMYTLNFVLRLKHTSNTAIAQNLPRASYCVTDSIESVHFQKLIH